MSSIDALVAYSQHRPPAATEKLPARPASGIAIVACMDARLNVYGALGLAEGDAHVIRNAGGEVTEDVIRSLIISQRLLGTTEVMLIHHTDCGMMSFNDDEVRAQIEAETGHRPPFPLGAFPDLEADVRESIKLIQSSPYLPNRDTVRGFIYEVESGRLREVTP
jgi:carbonic anhydrase